MKFNTCPFICFLIQCPTAYTYLVVEVFKCTQTFGTLSIIQNSTSKLEDKSSQPSEGEQHLTEMEYFSKTTEK